MKYEIGFLLEIECFIATFYIMFLSGLGHFLPTIFPIIFLYTEMHYRFRFFPFSRYFNREPEIIADIPYRLEPGHKLPILLLIKDAHLYPIILHSVKIEIENEEGHQKSAIFKKPIQIIDHWWHKILFIDINELSGNCHIDVLFQYEVNGQQKKCRNHNLKTSPSKSLTTFVSQTPLPGTNKNWFWGDIHYHSSYTEDFVEFGAPLDATQEIARSMGLSFVCVTDHSYDLDDKLDSWACRDPYLEKWKKLQIELDSLNKHSPPFLIPGEEVSTYNEKSENVHTLVLNHPEFIPGSGDSAERWFHHQTELSISEIVAMSQKNSLVIASHPRARFSKLERYLLNRGSWGKSDLETNDLPGFQILNGHDGMDFYQGLNHWKRCLLMGQKKYIYAGNDAHGNFNRFRQIKIPMLTTWDHQNHIFGKCKTGIYLTDNLNRNSIIQALKNGKCVISNGPLLDLSAENNHKSFTLGDSINGNNIRININNYSSYEYGYLQDITIHLGEVQSEKESTIFHHQFDTNNFIKYLNFYYSMKNIRGYIRGELTSQKNGKTYFCYTNPIWIHPKSFPP